MDQAIDNFFPRRDNEFLDLANREGRPNWIAFHFVWCTKRVKPVLVGEVGRRCDALIRALCREKGWDILHLSLFPACVHLFVRVSPDDSAHGVLRQIKAVTSNRLRASYPELTRLPSLWTRSYLSTTASRISDHLLLQYIYSQKHG